jgi:MtN3 and saliva related transmembrane protein
MVDTIQIIGYFAGFIIALSLIPQVIKAWKTKSTKDISLLWNSIYLFGLLLFLIYGIGIGQKPIMVACSIEISLAAALITAKIKYG